MSNAPQPGWYSAPGEPGFEREWDGSSWTEQRRALPPAVPASRNRVAIAAFVVGVVAVLLFVLYPLFTWLGVVPVAALVLGIVGVRRWRRQGGRLFAHLGLWFGVAMAVWAWFWSFARAFS